MLAAGGYGPAGFQNSAEIYDPATSVWTVTGSMPGGRWSHTATRLNDGRVLISGGENYAFCNTNCSIASTTTYDYITGIWTNTGDLGVVRAMHRAELLTNGQALVVGGYAQSNTTPAVSHVSAELFNPATNAWTPTGSLQESRYVFISVRLHDGDILVAGGQRITPGDDVMLGSAERYDRSSGSWTTIAILNQPRWALPATLLDDGSVLLAGGSDGTQTLSTA